MRNNLTGIILAAGENKRMKPLGTNLPKAMIPILGKPVLDHVISKVVDTNPQKIILVVSQKSLSPIKKYFKNQYKGISIEYVIQQEQLGPAQAIALALPHVNSDYFLVQYGDSLADQSIAKSLVETLNENSQADGVLAVAKVDDPRRYGIGKYQNDNITEVIEKPKRGEAPSNHAVIGTFILRTNSYKAAIKNQKFLYGKEFFPAQYILENSGKMKSWLFSGRRVDFGKPEDLFNASELLAKTRVKCIVFDADNTLYNSHEVAKGADREAMKLLARPANESPMVLYKTWHEFVSKIKKSKNPKERTRIYSYTKLCQKYQQGKELAQKMYAVFTKSLLQNLKVADNLANILKKLPQEKYIATDDVEHLAAQKLEHLKLKPYFKEVITADRVNTMKPSRKFYETILDKHRPQEVLVVGDDWRKDLEIPAKLGMQVMFVKNEDDLKKLLSLRGSTPLGIEPQKKRIHIMGIAGAGAAAVAGIAKEFGWLVDGCDIAPNSPYTKNLDINIKEGHNKSHIKNINMLIVSPAIEKTDPQNSELQNAKKLNIPVLTWQEFQGQYLQKGKFVICVAGAYGKTTTTAMISQILIDAGLDPTCEIGAKVLNWQSNFKVGKSKYYVCEGDEYNNNFLNYHPDIAVILNVAWDHPDFFKTQQDVLNSYQKFIYNIRPDGILILGSDPELASFTKSILNSKKGSDPMQLKIVKVDDLGKLNLSIIGDFRKENANAALTVAKVLGIDTKIAKVAVESFKGTGRRLEYKGEEKGVKFYDDYAVQPYTVLKTADALKQKFAQQKVTLVFEPHTFSRINTFFDQFTQSLKSSKVDEILITQVFAAREIGDKKELAQKLVKSIGKKAKFTGSIYQTAGYVRSNLEDMNIVLSMGAGNSYKLYELIKQTKTRIILEEEHESRGQRPN